MATATNEQGGTASDERADGSVLDAAPTVTAPTISGVALVGDTLMASASSGSWTIRSPTSGRN